MIYFIQAGEDGPIKIGFTNGPIKNRLAGLQTGSIHKLKVLFVYKGDTVTEKQLHYFHRYHRLRGEWFNNVPEIHAEIASLKIKQTFESLFGPGYTKKVKKKMDYLVQEAWAECAAKGL